eukprot:TRINITY_DN7828_c1_g1_i1.p1 TRINITY_DN7828_c1_g1~~TRINITY_DN7828_c1_g1_i1.p1  ORF type:complete len:1239 (+),score=287.97 TRINITY_DN7828_c1_g1_i1:75-3791(+)
MQSPRLGAKMRNKRPEALKPVNVKERGLSTFSDASCADASSVSDSHHGTVEMAVEGMPPVTHDMEAAYEVRIGVDTEVHGTKKAVLAQQTLLTGERYCGLHHLVFYSSSLHAPKSTTLQWCTAKTSTTAVVLLSCLNVGTDPPDSIKVSPYPVLQCWKDPRLCGEKRKACEVIISALRSQYNDLSNKTNIRYYTMPDVTYDELSNIEKIRKHVKSDHRIVVHYNGHGVPAPSAQGELWVFDAQYTQYMPVKASDLLEWIAGPVCVILDVRRAGLVLNKLRSVVESSGHADVIVLAACHEREDLPTNSYFPADVFGSCLTTPVKMAVLWHCYSTQRYTHSQAMNVLQIIDGIPSLASSLLRVLSTLIDSIAWSSLSAPMFLRFFKQDSFLTSLFRNFILAQRIMLSLNATPLSYPALPLCTNHVKWDEWDWHLDQFLTRCTSATNKIEESQSLMFSFFKAQQCSFAHSVACFDNDISLSLPIIIPSLCIPQCQSKTLALLARYSDGCHTNVNKLLTAGLLPYMLMFCKSPPPPSAHCHHLLYLWMKALTLADDHVANDAVQCMPFFSNLLRNCGDSPVLHHLSVCIITILCKTQSSARGKVYSTIFCDFSEVVLQYAKREADDHGRWGSGCGILNWMLLLASTVIEGEQHLIAELIGKMGVSEDCTWLLLCSRHPLQAIRSATMNLVRLLSLRMLDAVHFDNLDGYLLSLLTAGCTDLSAWVRLSAAKGLLTFVSSLHSSRANGSFASLSSVDVPPEDDHDDLMGKAMAAGTALLSDPMSQVATVGEMTVAMMRKPKELASTSSRCKSPMSPLKGCEKAGKGADLSTLDEEMEDPSDERREYNPRRSTMTLATPVLSSGMIESAGQGGHVSLLSSSIAYAACVTLEGEDLSSTRHKATLWKTRYTRSAAATCLASTVQKAGKISFLAETDINSIMRNHMLHPTLCLALYSSKDTVSFWNWRRNKTGTSLKVRSHLGAISSLEVLHRHDVSPLLVATSKGNIMLAVDWCSSKCASVSAFQLVSNPTHECIARVRYKDSLWCTGGEGIKVADLCKEQEVASIVTGDNSAVSALVTPHVDGDYGMVGHQSGCLFTVDDREKEGTLMVGQHSAHVTGISLACEEAQAQGYGVSSIAIDGQLCVWDVRKPLTAVAVHDLCKKEGRSLAGSTLHATLPLAMTCSTSSSRLHHIPTRTVTHLSTAAEREGIFKTRFTPTSSVFHPLAPISLSVCSTGKMVLLSFAD